MTKLLAQVRIALQALQYFLYTTPHSTFNYLQAFSVIPTVTFS